MPIGRYSMIFELATQADQKADASNHIGGWSESFWSETIVDLTGQHVKDLCEARAKLLPDQASIVGVRLGQYTISGNRMIPGGTASFKKRFPGNARLDCDLPQVSLQISLAGAGGNTSRIALRGIPDDIMKKGEYTPPVAFKNNMRAFLDVLTGAAWGFVGRDLTVANQKIISIEAGAMKVRGALGLAVGDYVRILKCKDITKKPVTGTYRVSVLADGDKTLTLENFPAVTVKESGSARWDKVRYADIIGAEPSRAVVRKIGSPFERYRGRASKKTA